ncbi:hypothetical protein CHH91_02465 [Virgibacillus sp. 7505]|uniref:hypothetical protein n=1 Tax=Virgibacillus sp. 7505 TaxID=2022548 RepID=UPI000BA7C04E|nr:hypothetical protein [Virgibacillus sp. 7505]PAE17651.1 hypothetical protein CHH91_02465 [Virgibacillus sp. 7505]
MKVKERHFPYPVLADFSGDYQGSSYETDITYDVNREEFVLTVKHDLNNKELTNLIANNNAKYCVHIECAKTQNRILETSVTSVQQVNLKASVIEKSIEVCTFIVANTEIENYTNSQFDDDYKGYTFNVSKGDILAIGYDFNINIEKDQISDSESIIQIEKNVSDSSEPISITLNTERIVVSLNSEIYALYTNLAGQDELQPILHSLIGIPVVSAALQAMSEEISDDNDFYNETSDLRWFKILFEKINALGLDPEAENTYEEPINLAQRILNDPFSKSLKALYSIMEDDSEDGEEL